MASTVASALSRAPRPTGPLKRVRTTALLNLFHLVNIRTSPLRIGPLSCQKWFRHLENFFRAAKEAEENFQFDKHFESVDDLFGPCPDMDSSEGLMKAGMGIQFMGRLALYASRREGLTQKQLLGPALIFLTLLGLSYRIGQGARPLNPVIDEANKTLETLSEKYGLPLPVIVP
jgi:hypothetical protein